MVVCNRAVEHTLAMLSELVLALALGRISVVYIQQNVRLLSSGMSAIQELLGIEGQSCFFVVSDVYVVAVHY